MSEPFVSYAPNAEDVVLWRVLRNVYRGTYVDIGATDPFVDSVTAALHLERGWSGLHVARSAEAASRLRLARPGDVTLEATAAPLDEVLAAGGLTGQEIHLLRLAEPPVARTDLSGFDLARWRPWVVVLGAAPAGSPAGEDGLGVLTAAGYHIVLFDGLNHFAVSPEHPELVGGLSAPVNVLDEPWETASQRHRRRALEERGRAAAEQAEQWTAANEAEHRRSAQAERAVTALNGLIAGLAEDGAHLRRRATASAANANHLNETSAAVEAEAEALRHTVSWRVTGPLRAVYPTVQRSRAGLRRLVRRRPSPANGADEQPPTTTLLTPAPAETAAPEPVPATGTAPASPPADEPADDDRWSAPEAAFLQRLSVVTDLLAGGSGTGESSSAAAHDLLTAKVAFESTLATTTVADHAVAWLAWVAARGAYPAELELEAVARILQLGGRQGLAEWLQQEFLARRHDGNLSLRRLRPVPAQTIVDVTHTAAHDFHTGIQRVVREVTDRWVSVEGALLVAWEPGSRALGLLSDREVARFRAWRERTGTGPVASRQLVTPSDDLVVPWRATMVIPELAAEPDRTDCYRALGRAGVTSRLSLIGYDLIPVTVPETVAEGMGAAFAGHLGVAKWAQRVSAISAATAEGYAAYAAMLASQGLTGPDVAAHPLPCEAPALRADAVERTRIGLGGHDDLPMVLVVGSHEPRKNHVAVLVAAERLWRAGRRFRLVLLGSRGWRSEPFDELVERLLQAGRPLLVVRTAGEELLWAAYRLARFTVFPSLSEGYGLPVAESLVCGTPVITSNFGSMAEIAADGGTLTVDPRRPAALEAAMATLLDDDAELERLRHQAAGRSWSSWDRYATDTWRHLVE